MTGLTLKRASASRPSGEWNDDDYDVLAEGDVGSSCDAFDVVARGHDDDGSSGSLA
jgi:hypothetical protein